MPSRTAVRWLRGSRSKEAAPGGFAGTPFARNGERLRTGGGIFGLGPVAVPGPSRSRSQEYIMVQDAGRRY
jgi:hypothetical protein